MAFLSFYVTRSITEMPERIAVLFHHHNGADSDALSEAIEELTNRRLPPTRIIVICGLGDEARIQAQFVALESTTRGRLSIITHLQILPYDSKGRLVQDRIIELAGSGWAVDDQELLKIAHEGLDQLIIDCGVILKAPRGYVFRKPSGNTNRIFVRTGNLFRQPSSLGLLSYLLMRSIPLGIEKLYIDSFTILSAALSFNRTRNRISKSEGVGFLEPEIVNLHSYSIDPQLRFPGDIAYSVLISASTSGGLARKLEKEHGGDSERMIHLLGLSKGDELKSSSVFFREMKDQSTPIKGVFQKEISIPGEEFIASSSSPQPVSITRDHFSPIEQDVFKSEYYQSALSVSFAAHGNSAYSLIELADGVCGQNPEFDKWLKGEVELAIPASVGWILSVNGGTARALSERVQTVLSTCLGRNIPIFEIKEVSEKFELPKDLAEGTVLVVSAVTGTGEDLLAASRALRNLEVKHRHYLVGHLFPETAFQLSRLKSNLCVSGGRRDYGWSSFIGMPVGLIDSHDSWYVERFLLAARVECPEWDALASGLKEALARRIGFLELNSIKGGELFLPRVDLGRLELRKDSILFTKPYGGIAQSTVYVMVSGGLQRARDRKGFDGRHLKEDQCFEGNPFVASVLDPGMFARFNDGVIQAAFLRACAPDELNYANDRVLSRQMRDILISAIRHCEVPTGEAVFEMLLALATKRLRLKDAHFDEVVAEVGKIGVLEGFWRLLKAESEV